MKLNQYEWEPKRDKIGEGSFAEVFEARDNNGDPVALKIYRSSVVQSGSEGSSNGKYSLENEFLKGKHLSHTNIIRYIGLDYLLHKNVMEKEEKFPVLIMEFADAGSLDDRLNGNANTGEKTIVNFEVLDESKKISIAKEILAGIGYLHEQGIIHRDLKPANILFKTDRTGRKVVKITDFGVSRDNLTKDLGATTFGVGTVSYMAPEQFSQKTYGLNQTISERTDIWAFGVIFYRLLTGSLPFNSQEQITDTEVNLAPVPAPYRGIIRGCLQKHASKRYASAKEVTFELNRLKPSKTLKPKSSFPVKIIAIAASILLLALVVFWGSKKLKSIRFNSHSYDAPDSTNLTVIDEPTKGIYVTNKSFQQTDTDKNTGSVIISPYRYTGSVINSLPNGQGTKTFQNGDKYTGLLKNGRPEGNGTAYIKQDNGFDVYEGSFQNGVLNGSGSVTYANKDKYVGEFKNNMKDGRGTLYFYGDGPAHGDRYVGEFSNDIFNGSGKYYWREGQIYEGNYQNGGIQGKGTMIFIDGTHYTGNYEAGEQNGYGVQYFKNGDRYEGYFKNNLCEGEGVMYYANGTRYDGMWSNGSANGYGKGYNTQGELVHSGYFINGVLQSHPVDTTPR